MILSYYYTGIHKEDLSRLETKAQSLKADYQSFVVGPIERNMHVRFTGDSLKDCEKKASKFRRDYANKKEIGPWSREVR
jgi:hypothetical protein